jgi:hypothetical protein
VRDGEEIQLGVVFRIVVVVIFVIAIIIVLRLAQRAETHHHNLIFGFALTGDITRLRSSDDPGGMGERGPFSAEIVAQDVERETRPVVRHLVEGEVDRVVWNELLVVSHLGTGEIGLQRRWLFFLVFVCTGELV